MRLHIFEERYRKMINHCLEENKPFGVVLIRKGMEAHGPLAEPYRIGCSAYITQLQRYPDGRMNLLAKGEERFRILSLDSEALPYLIGNIEVYPLADPDPEASVQKMETLLVWLERYAGLLSQVRRTTFRIDSLPREPAKFAFVAAALLNLPLISKQEVLSAADTISLMARLEEIYRKEVAILKAQIDERGELHGGFSKN